jgi:hypothetical protein
MATKTDSEDSAPAPVPVTKAELQQQIADLAAENATLKAAQKQASADEELIAKKMMLGLSRSQAIAVIQRQRAHDGDAKVKEFRAAKADALKKRQAANR